MDSIFLTGPLGTTFNVGSWLDKTQPVDYGAAGLIRQQLTQTTFVEGAQLAYETAAGARKMSFPLIVPSGGVAGLSLDAIEASLRQMVRPGGYVDMQPANVPTAEMVRFDILGGDVAQRGYSVDLRRVSRGLYNLSLETQPFGYWPTWITLASVASVAPMPGVSAPILAASVIGDAPAQVRLAIRSDIPAAASAGSWPAQMDFVAWSLGGGSGVPTFIPASSFAGAAGAALVADGTASAFGGQAWHASVRSFSDFSLANFNTVVGPNFAGRHRAFAFFRHGGGNAHSLRAMIDVSGRDSSVPAATSNPVATIPAVASLLGATYYALYDLGEITLPAFPDASSYAGWSGNLRVWVGGATDGSLASTSFDFAGVYLLPVDGPAGIMPRGLLTPTALSWMGQNDIFFDSAARIAGLRGKANTSLDVANQDPWMSAQKYYRGVQPHVGGTNVTLRILPLERYTATVVLTDGGPPVRRNTSYVGYSLAYQPRFQFLKGF